MGMFDPKKRKIITAVIAVILVLAMVVPSVLFYFIIKGELEIRTLEEEYETRTAGVRSTAGGNYRKNISGR